LAIVAERMRVLGITDEAYARARNHDRRRTPEKRELLRHVQRRARGWHRAVRDRFLTRAGEEPERVDTQVRITAY
jgi:hypothetical protein